MLQHDHIHRRRARALRGLAVACVVTTVAPPIAADAARIDTQVGRHASSLLRLGPTTSGSSAPVAGMVHLYGAEGDVVIEGVLTRLPAGARYSVGASAQPCSQLPRDRAPRLMGSMYGGSADDSGQSTVLRASSRRSGRIAARARSFVVIVRGGTHACGAARAFRKLVSFRLHPVEGQAARGIVHLTRASESSWNITGFVAGLSGRHVLALSSMCPPSADVAGWGAIPRGVVNSEGWDEVPPELMFGVKASGLIGGSASADLSGIRSAAILNPRATGVDAIVSQNNVWQGQPACV